MKLKLEDLESLNIAHQKRLSKAKVSDSVDIEVLLHERDQFANKNANMTNYILATHKKSSKDIEEKNEALQDLSRTVARYETHIIKLEEAVSCEKDTSRHLREQLTDNIGRQNLAKKRIEILQGELLSAKNASEISNDLQMLQTKTNSELVKCVDEMEQLMCVSKQLVKGEEPNIFKLIGVHSSAMRAHGASHSRSLFPWSENVANNPDQTKDNSSQRGLIPTNDDNIKRLRDILQSIEKIRKQVSELREILSDRYAESIADNVSNCSTQ